jgi:hypothetical protein
LQITLCAKGWDRAGLHGVSADRRWPLYGKTPPKIGFAIPAKSACSERPSSVGKKDCFYQQRLCYVAAID